MSQQEKERLGEGKERGNTSHRDLSDERVRVRADKRNRLVEAERASRQHEQKRERWIGHAKFLRTHRRQQCGPKTRTGWLKTTMQAARRWRTAGCICDFVLFSLMKYMLRHLHRGCQYVSVLEQAW
jgi:hypothetical protein